MEKRLIAAAALCMFLFSVILAVLAVTMTNPEYRRQAENQSTVRIELENGRGNFYDCNFKQLTGNFTQLYYLTESGRKSYHDHFESIPSEKRDDFYRAIQRHRPFLIPAEAKKKEKTAGCFEVNRTRRYLPMPIAPHLIGYLDAQGNGAAGAERAFDGILRKAATSEMLQCRINARGGILPGIEPEILYTKGTGEGIVLTLDSAVQRGCEAIAETMIDRGCIVVMESATGRIRAAVSKPSFHPEQVAQSMQKNDTSLVNRIMSAYNVGSVFKPLLAATALEQGIDPDRTYFCSGAITVGDHVYHCAYGKGHGTVNLQQALEQSCNCYFIHLGQKLGGKTVNDAAARAGFGRKIQIAENFCPAAGYLPASEELESAGELAGISFGQGKLTANPLQVTAMMNLFANDGIYIEPVFVEGIFDSYLQDMRTSLYHPARYSVFSRTTARKMKKLLTGVVENGLGRKAMPRAGGAAGKTGTAQTGRFSQNGEEIMDAWFTGFYPAVQPRYTITVLLDSGQHSSDDAARIFAKTADMLGFLLKSTDTQKEICSTRQRTLDKAVN